MPTTIVIILTGFVGLGALLILIGTALNAVSGGSGNGYLFGGVLCVIAGFILALIAAFSGGGGGGV